MILADSHTHLYLKEFDNDRDEVIERALAAGIRYFFLPNIDTESIPSMMQLSGSYPGIVFPMIGLHPTSVKADFGQQLAVVEQKLGEGGFVAIGETGIDLYWDKTYIKEQEAALTRQISLAKGSGLPIVIHSRESFDEIFKIMDDNWEPGLTGVFHCFTGNAAQAERIINWGFKLGIGGVITFKNSGLAEVLKYVGLEHIILETDSPYLSPMPYRGKRNESSYLIHVAEKLAEVKGVALQQVAEITTRNTLKLFGIWEDSVS